MSAEPPAVGEVLILCYHSTSPTWPALTNVPPGALAAQLDWLQGAGYRSATLSDALTDPPAKRTVVLTFDDAHRSVLEFAAPLLAERGFVATVFAPTDYVDRGAPMGWEGYEIWLGTEHEHELTPMSWTELGELADSGWEVGSHPVTHPDLRAVAEDERLAAELADSRRRCEEQLGRPCPTIAYPYGFHDARVRRAAAAAGYTVGATMPTRAERPLPLAWPRIGVYRKDGLRRLRARIVRRRLGV